MTIANLNNTDMNSWSIETIKCNNLYKKYISKKLIISKIQRNFIWNKNEASLLIDSLLLDLPIPNLYLYHHNDTYMILDGYQRIRSIIYYMQNEWTTDQSTTEFKLTNTPKINPIWRNKTFYELTKDLQLKIKNYLFSIVVLKSMDCHAYKIVRRINTLGKSFTSQEYRNCAHHGIMNDLLIELNKFELWRILYNGGPPDDRMRDIEEILKFFILDNINFQKNEKNNINMKVMMNNFMSNDNISIDELQKFKNQFINVISYIYKNGNFTAFNNISSKYKNVFTFKFHKVIYESIMLAVSEKLKTDNNNIIKDWETRQINLLKMEIFQEYLKKPTTMKNILFRKKLVLDMLLT